MRNSIRKLFHKPSPSQVAVLLPEPEHCVTHLRLLRAFARLRNDVIQASHHSAGDKDAPEKANTSNGGTMRGISDEKTWLNFIEHAVARFESWWRSMVLSHNDGQMHRISTSTCLQPGKLEKLLQDTYPMIWTIGSLPPLDVLMVLHTYMLNPRFFLEDCIRFSMLPLWKAGMPWNLIAEVMDPSLLEYRIPESTEKAWTEKTGLSWNPFSPSLQQDFVCPACCLAANPRKTTGCFLKETVSEIDSSTFVAVCSQCNQSYSEDALRYCKFKVAVRDLQQKDVPLPGTILSFDGLARSSTTVHDEPDMFSPNRILKTQIGHPFEDKGSTHQIDKEDLKIQDLARLLENVLASNGVQHPKRCSRRVLAQFSDNYSLFGPDLSTAVIRQGVFIEKMEELDWLHSPALDYTVDNLLQKYPVFFKIMEQNKSSVAVPTHAVDLAWHTQQLSPARYYSFSLQNAANVFIDHDDRIEEDVRTDAFDWTCEQFAMLTNGSRYGQCLCWYCATALDSAKDERKLVLGKNGHIDLEHDPKTKASVSNQVAASQHWKLEDDYAYACKHAEKFNEKPPNQKIFLDTYQWLYPQAIPVISG